MMIEKRLPHSGQYFQLNTLSVSVITGKLKELVVLLDPSGNGKTSSSASVLSDSSFSVQFIGLSNNARYSLLIFEGLAYLDVETSSHVKLIQTSLLSIQNYATGSALIDSFSPQFTFESTLGQFCQSNLSPYSLTMLSQIENTQSNYISSLVLQSNKLKLSGKWNGESHVHRISEFLSGGYTYVLKSNIDINFQPLSNTQITIPLKFKRYLGAAFERVKIDSSVVSERPVEQQDLTSLFERYADYTTFYKVTADPNVEPVYAEFASGPAAETNVDILMTYPYYQADFFDWYDNPLVKVTINNGIMTMISTVVGSNYFTCPFGALRNEYQYFYKGDSYHSISYSSIHQMFLFDYGKKSWKMNTRVDIDTNGMMENNASISNFENTFTKSSSDGLFTVTLTDNAVVDYETYFTSNYLISKHDYREEIRSVNNFTLLYIDDLGTDLFGPLVVQESFVSDLQFNPGICDEPVGSRLGNQLSYYFGSSDYSVERLPEYSTRLSYEGGVTYNTDTKSIDLKYSNHEYLQDFVVEIDESILVFKEPKVESFNFTLIPNRSEWNEMNATISIFSYNSGDMSGEFTVELTCSYPIIILNSSPQKFVVLGGQNYTAHFNVRSDFDSCKTVSLISNCDIKISVKREQLWTIEGKEKRGSQNVAVDYGYFIPRCQAKYNEPFLWLDNITLASNHFTRTSEGFFNSILVFLKTNSSDSILSNIVSSLISSESNPFYSLKEYTIVMQNSEVYLLNFSISSNNIARILSERVDNTPYMFSLNLTLLDNYVCWSNIGKGGIFPFTFGVLYDCPVEYTGIQCDIPFCYGINATNYTSVCSGHGDCVSPDHCYCNENYTSTNCSIPVCFGVRGDNIHTCSSKGSCIDANTCYCENGYTGPNCEIPICYDIPANYSHTCFGQGLCIDKNNCTCHAGYTSSNCSLPICFGFDSSQYLVCSTHGECVSPNDCVCHTGFTSNNCSVPICYGIEANNQSVCTSFGECMSPNQCLCFDNHIGQKCEIPVCFGVPANDSKVCSTHGSCNYADGCDCQFGFTGLDCSIPICFGINATNGSVCSAHGLCSGKDICECSQGYTGIECAVPICFGVMGNLSLSCSGHGTCLEYDNCSCITGYVNEDCSIPVCFGLNKTDVASCSSHGECISPNNCTCSAGFTSNNCSVPICYGIEANNQSVCTSFGECMSPNQCLCFENHTGEECEIPSCFGIPANNFTSCNGNGVCFSVDTCECYYNFTGLDCSTPICFGFDATDKLVCNAHGRCFEPDICECFEGYTGPQCETPICFNVPATSNNTCSGEGKCIDFNQCVCNQGFTSTNCSIPICFTLNATDSNVCSSHGQCISPENCTCTEGFTHFDCSHPICYGLESADPNSCSSHGTCFAPNLCECDTNHVGELCDIPLCFGIAATDNTTCSGTGQCVNVNKCECFSNYTGLNCSVPVCFDENSTSILTCSSRGRCIGPNVCQCQDGYTGEICQYPICHGIPSSEKLACSGHGTCSDYNECKCENGYITENCSIPVCFGFNSTDTNACSGHGDCISPSNCSCTDGFTSVNCSVPICYSLNATDNRVCSGKGKCLKPDNCSCNEGYNGPSCEIPVCFGIPGNDILVACNGNGYCSHFNQCDCFSNFTGTQCSIPLCFGLNGTDTSACSSHGYCVSPNGCQCRGGYTGIECQIPICFEIAANNSNTCSGHGNCLDADKCSCHNGYSGENCSVPICFNLSNTDPNVCNGHGECSSPDVCQCDENFTGDNCSIPICFGWPSNTTNACSSWGKCLSPNICICKEGYAGTNCEIPSCFDIYKNESGVCSGNGVCEDLDTCLCYLNFTGDVCSVYECFGVVSNDSMACSGKGDCVAPNLCKCSENYYGENCEISNCFGYYSNDSNACSGKGECQSYNQCTCSGGYIGSNCSIAMCFGINSTSGSVCNSNGDCVAPDTCSCNDRFEGLECNEPKCFGKSTIQGACNKRGNCSAPDSCRCNSGYVGDMCELHTCFGISTNEPVACSGHGNCKELDQCECMTGYIGNDCSVYTCFGVAFNETTVCSGRGNCTDMDNCTCMNGYTSPNCSLAIKDGETPANDSSIDHSYPICFNITSNSSSVCNRQGNCTDENVCQCKSGYMGDDCSVFSCYGMHNKDLNVCSSKGVCVNPNICQCNPESFGSFCQIVKCFGILSNESTVCSASGTCQDTNQCHCKEGYFGSVCNVTICEKTYSNNSQVCSGNGQCKSYNKCQCKEGYIGSYCQFTTCNSTSCRHGQCISPSRCECESGWTGTDCSIPICFEHLESDPNVCSSHGKCTAPNTCNCSSNPLYMGNKCQHLQLDGIQCSLNPTLNLVPIDWSIGISDKIIFDMESGKEMTIRKTIEHGSQLYSKSKFNYELNIGNSGKRAFDYQIISYCSSGISFKQLGTTTQYGLLAERDTATIKDVANLGFVLFWNEHSQRYEDLTCHVELILNSHDQFDECRYYESNNVVSTKYNITLIFENTNVCQFLKETDLSLTLGQTDKISAMMEDLEEVNENLPSDSILKITNIFTQKRNNWQITNKDNNTIQANILLTAQLSNPSYQLGTFIPSLACQDERISDNIEFTTEYLSNQSPIVLSHTLEKIQFQFNVTIKNVSINYVDYGRVRGGKEGTATLLIPDLSLNCTLILLPNPLSCWSSNNNRNSTLSKYIISQFTLPIVSGEFSFFQAIRSFEVGIITLTYTCMGIGFASMICTTKVPRDRKHSLLQLVEFVKEKRRNKLNSTDEKPLLLDNNQTNRPCCENCGHHTRKKAQFAIRVENYEPELYICDNQACFEAMISLHNRGYSHHYQCFDLDNCQDDGKMIMIETPFRAFTEFNDESDIYESMNIEFPIPSDLNDDEENDD